MTLQASHQQPLSGSNSVFKRLSIDNMRRVNMGRKFLFVIFTSLLVSGCGTALNENGNKEEQVSVNKESNETSEDESYETEVQTPIDEDSESTGTFSNEYKTKLMEDVESSDILFHEKIAFLEIEFSVRDNIDHSAGKDIYNISYLTSAEPEETKAAYDDYLDTITDEWASEYSLDLEGFVNELPISVSIMQDPLMDMEGYPVRITISEKPENFQDENRYFNDYANSVELYKSEDDILFYRAKSYAESYRDGIKTYHIDFATTADEDDFGTFYTENYNHKANFNSEENEYENDYSWSDSEFEHLVRFSKLNQGASVYVTAPLP